MKSAVSNQQRVIVIRAVLAATLLIFPAAAFGDEGEPAGMWVSFREAWSSKLRININYAGYEEDSTLEPENWSLGGKATLQLSRDLGRGVMLQIDPRLNAAPRYTRGARLFLEDHENRPVFTLNEAYVAWFGDTLEIEAGKKIFSWKVADAFSPVDTLNPVDLVDPMDMEKIGVLSVSVLKMFEKMNVQAVLLPAFAADRPAPDSSRWSAGAMFSTIYEQEPASRKEIPENRFEKMSVASRISSSTLLPGWDLAAIYRHGYSTRGVIRLDAAPLLSPPLIRVTDYQAYNLYGLTFSTVWGSIEGHGEAAVTDTRDNVKGEDYLSYIFGVTYISYNLLPDVFEEISFIMEYAGDKVLRERNPDSTYADQSTSRGLSSNIIGSVEFKINEDHNVKTGFMYNLSDEDSILEVSGESHINDHLRFAGGYQRLSGDTTSFIGQWDANDRLYLEMSIIY